MCPLVEGMCIKLVHVTDIRNQGPKMWNWDCVFPIMQAVFCLIYSRFSPRLHPETIYNGYPLLGYMFLSN